MAAGAGQAGRRTGAGGRAKKPVFFSPGGAAVVSQRRQPLGPPRESSGAPEGRQSLPPLRGSQPFLLFLQGLSPLANHCRPSGAPAPHRVTEGASVRPRTLQKTGPLPLH